jgi:phytanoyl-CoA hydroxylase
MAAVLEELRLQEITSQFDRDGFVVTRGLFSPADIAEIRDTFMDLARNGPVEGISEYKPGLYKPEDPLAQYPRMMHPHSHPELPVGPLARRFMLDPRLYGFLRSFLRDEPLAVQSMFYFKPPGARGQSLHQDNFYLRVKPGTCMAAWIAVDDADEENGGMMCVPKTSNMEIVCPEKADAATSFTNDYVAPPPGTHPVPVNLKAGDVLLFNGSVIHGSFPNTSATRFRRSLIFHYAPLAAQELARFYRNPITFDGRILYIANAVGGGPCGSLQEVGAPH